MIGCLADYRAGRQNRQNWLQGRLAGLTCNLPEQLHDLMLTGPSAGATECGPVTRRDMLELLPTATVRSVLAVRPVSMFLFMVACKFLCMFVCTFLLMCMSVLMFVFVLVFMLVFMLMLD